MEIQAKIHWIKMAARASNDLGEGRETNLIMEVSSRYGQSPTPSSYYAASNFHCRHATKTADRHFETQFQDSAAK